MTDKDQSPCGQQSPIGKRLREHLQKANMWKRASPKRGFNDADDRRENARAGRSSSVSKKRAQGVGTVTTESSDEQKARVSETDPQARVMKQADEDLRPVTTCRSPPTRRTASSLGSR
jgi:hypothetical protein